MFLLKACLLHLWLSFWVLSAAARAWLAGHPPSPFVPPLFLSIQGLLKKIVQRFLNSFSMHEVNSLFVVVILQTKRTVSEYTSPTKQMCIKTHTNATKARWWASTADDIHRDQPPSTFSLLQINCWTQKKACVADQLGITRAKNGLKLHI